MRIIIAARGLSDRLRGENPHIPWAQIAAFPELGATVTRLAAGLIVRVAEFELSKRVPVDVAPVTA
jgi:hypothetical protein